MWVQASGPPDRQVVLFDYTTSRAQEVPLRLLEGYRGYVVTDDYADYTPWRYSQALNGWRAWRMPGVSSSKRRKCSPRARRDVPTWRWR